MKRILSTVILMLMLTSGLHAQMAPDAAVVPDALA